MVVRLMYSRLVSLWLLELFKSIISFIIVLREKSLEILNIFKTYLMCLWLV